MIRWNTFARSAAFAAAAAIGCIAWNTVARPIAGGAIAIVVYLVGVTAVYLAGIGPDRIRRPAVVLAAVLLAGWLGVFARTPGELAIGLAIILATARSVFLYRAPAARAVATEAVLVIGGLLFARFLAASSLALAIWGFLLVQSCFFLVGGVRVRPTPGRHPDPFEDAYGRAIALIEEAVSGGRGA